MASSRDISPLSSQLSSHGSSEFGDDIKVEDHDQDQSPDALPDDESHLMPPVKRRRTGQYSHQSTPVPLVETEDLGDISSDTEGSIPGSPIGDRVLGFPDDDPAVPPEQITYCKWKDCPRGECGDMDTLVQHIHDDHIGKNKKRYACEWEGCNKKENTLPNAHASGYALKAHMRSHTKEKPFYCRLPECDRSFTRSDALAKHMRTVHETEALRPSDPVPKNYTSVPPKPQRLKLILNSKPRHPNSPPAQNEDTDPEDNDPAPIYSPASDNDEPPTTSNPTPYPPDISFTPNEASLPPQQLFRLLRRQHHWTLTDNVDLRGEVALLEQKRKEEWLAKELVLANVMEAELALAHDKGESQIVVHGHLKDLPQPILPMVGEVPWYRTPVVPVEVQQGVGVGMREGEEQERIPVEPRSP